MMSSLLDPQDALKIANSTTSSNATGANNPSVSPTSLAGEYDHGLDGVNVWMDNISSQTLYVSIGIVCIIIFTVRLLQRANGHLRQVVSLGGSSSQQAFWKRDHNSWWPKLKKHLFYAPLRHKRHNREIQLSSAVNVGVIPGRFHALLLTLYLLSNVIYMAMLNYNGQPRVETLAELRGRSGHLATMNCIALWLMAGRNNPFIPLLKVSFNTFNLLHRWIGRLVALEASIHTIAWAANKSEANGWQGLQQSVNSSAFLQWGMVSLVAMLIIFVQAASLIRHAFYETFLHLHRLLAFFALLGLYLHCKLGSLPQLSFVIFVILLWSYDWIMRIFHLIYRNYAFRKGFTRVIVEALPGEACRVTFHTPKPWTPPAGTFAYIYIPRISFWMSHPFSVAWTTTSAPHPDYVDLLPAPSSPTSSIDIEKHNFQTTLTSLDSSAETSISFITAARTGFTRQLYNRASTSRSGRATLIGFLEGPYGTFENLHSYSTLLFFAGGVGITHCLPHIRSLILDRHLGVAPVQRITLVWAVRSSDMFEWIRPWMDEILALPGRREVLRIQLFVTKPKGPRDVASASERVQVFPGRPVPKVIVEREFNERKGAMYIGICGPGALGDEVREAARGVVDRGKVDFEEQEFNW